MAATPESSQNPNSDNARAEFKPSGPGRRTKVIPENLVRFLELLRHNGNVSMSSRMIGWSRTTVYAFAKENPEFGAAMREAVTEGREMLVGEAWRRATEWSTFKPNEGADIQVKPPSDRLLGLLIQGYFQEFKSQRTDEPLGEDLLPETADLTKLSNAELEALENILSKVGGNVNVVGTGES